MAIKFNPQNLIIYIFFFSLNFETLNTFNLGIDFLITKITVSILILFALLNYKSFYSLSDYSEYLYPILTFFVLVVVISYLNRTPSFKHFFSIPLFLNLLILIILTNYSSNKPDILLKGLFVMTLSTILLAIIYYFGFESKDVGTSNNINIRATILGGNANDIGLKLTISLFILMSVIFENKLEIGKNRYYLLLFLPFLLKFLIDTGSRVAFLSFFLGVNIMFIVYLKNLRFIKRINLIIIGSFLLIVGLVIIFKNDTLVVRLYDAFFKGDLSHRDNIWSKIIPIIKKNLFWGVGETGYAQRVTKIFGSNASPHNVFLEVLAFTGIAGMIFFLIFFYRLFLAAFRKFKYQNELLPIVLLVPILGTLISGQIFEQKIFWVLFAYIIGSSTVKVKGQTEYINY